MKYHERSVSIKIDVSGGDNKSIIDMKINVSRGPLGAKLTNFLGAPPMLTEIN